MVSWNKSRNNWPAAHINGLHKQLADILPAFLSYGDSQLHDLRTNQQWLKTMMWQLSVNNGNRNGEDSMFQQYSANMANNLLSGMSSMPQQNSEMLNVSLVCVYDLMRGALADEKAVDQVIRCRLLTDGCPCSAPRLARSLFSWTPGASKPAVEYTICASKWGLPLRASSLQQGQRSVAEARQPYAAERPRQCC